MSDQKVVDSVSSSGKVAPSASYFAQSASVRQMLSKVPRKLRENRVVG